MTRLPLTEHDLVAALHIRDMLEPALAGLPTELVDAVRARVQPVDEEFRSFTEADSGRRIAFVAQIGLDERDWWWFGEADRQYGLYRSRLQVHWSRIARKFVAKCRADCRESLSQA